MLILRRTLIVLFIAALLFGAGGFLLDSVAQAQSGLVPCGHGAPCDLCDLYVLVKNIIDFILLKFILPVAVISLLIGGILILTSRGNPSQLQTGKAALYNTVIGIIIAFAAWLLISTLLSTLGFKNFNGGLPWNKFPECKPPIVPAFTGSTGTACNSGVNISQACTLGRCAGIQQCESSGRWGTCVKEDQACKFFQ